MYLKRETLFATYSSKDADRIRELVSYRARIDTIKVLVPRRNIDLAARTLYEVTGQRPPGGSKSAARKLTNTYTSLANRVDLNVMVSELHDLRHAGFEFEDSLINVYRSYRARIPFAVGRSSKDESKLITFDHFYSLALELETQSSRLIRCTSCGSRNVLPRNASATSLRCVFCEILTSAKKRAGPRKVATA
jgi:hypothetical protein